MSDVCIEYEKFLYFNDFPAYLNELYFDNKTFRFEFLQYPFSAYVKMKNVTVHDNVSFLISPFHKIPWKQLFFNVNPIAYELNKRLFAFPDKIQFVFRDDPDMAAAPILSLFSSRNLTKIEDIHCFSNLVITETDSDIPININAKLNYQVVKDFSFTRMRFERNKTVKNSCNEHKKQSPVTELNGIRPQCKRHFNIKNSARDPGNMPRPFIQ